MDEFEIIRRYFSRDGGIGGDAGVVVGVGDDGAVLLPEPGRELVTVVDTLVQDVHFPARLRPGQIAYRAVAANLSDLAAMGARPRWMTLALTIPDNDEGWLSDFAEGLYEAAEEHSLVLVGGDTTSGRDIIVTIQLIGDVEPNRSLLRSGACAGDRIYVTGTVGDAAAGLECLRNNKGGTESLAFLLGRFCRPTARVQAGYRLATFASAGIDVSDGLFSDLTKLLDCSGVGGRIETGLLPLSSALRMEYDDAHAVRLALGGGEDFELCFTMHARHDESVNTIATESGTSITCIGSVVEGGGLVVLADGKETEYFDTGFRHF